MDTSQLPHRAPRTSISLVIWRTPGKERKDQKSQAGDPGRRQLLLPWSSQSPPLRTRLASVPLQPGIFNLRARGRKSGLGDLGHGSSWTQILLKQSGVVIVDHLETGKRWRPYPYERGEWPCLEKSHALAVGRVPCPREPEVMLWVSGSRTSLPGFPGIGSVKPVQRRMPGLPFPEAASESA